MVVESDFESVRSNLFDAIESARRALQYVGIPFLPIDIRALEKKSCKWEPLPNDKGRDVVYLCSDPTDGVREIMLHVKPGGEIFPHKYGERCFRMEVIDGEIVDGVSGKIIRPGESLEIKKDDKRHFSSTGGATFILHYKV